MTKNRRFNTALVITLLVVTALGGVFASAAFAQLKPVKVALASKEVQDNVIYFIGMRMGFFKEVGLDFQPSYFRGGGEVIRAVVSRSTDITGTNSAAGLFIAISKGEPIKIVSGGSAPLVGVFWVVKADSPIKSVKDLKGKKVGMSSPGSLTHTTLLTILRAEGLEKDVEVVRVGGAGDSWTAIRNGVVDASWHVSPPVYPLVAQKEARIIIDAADYIKHYQQSAVAVMEDMIKKDPDMIRNFLKARAKAVRFFYDQPDKTISIWAEELKLPEDAVRLAHKSIPRTFFEAGAPKTENLMAAMQEAIATGAMKEPLDLKQILDLRFLPPDTP